MVFSELRRFEEAHARKTLPVPDGESRTHAQDERFMRWITATLDAAITTRGADAARGGATRQGIEEDLQEAARPRPDSRGRVARHTSRSLAGAIKPGSRLRRASRSGLARRSGEATRAPSRVYRCRRRRAGHGDGPA